MAENISNVVRPTGLSESQVALLQKQYGKNLLRSRQQWLIFRILKDIIAEPMFILLAIACTVYFALGQVSEGLMMVACIIIVGAISVFQDLRSTRALDALKKYTEPKVTVIRNNTETLINSEELVPGDIILVAEGQTIPADAKVTDSNDFTVNESIITGESFPVSKNAAAKNNQLFQGSTIETGKAVAEVTATGYQTLLGKIGKTISITTHSKTLLQIQIARFVRTLALFGLIGFLVIFIVNLFHYHEFTTSLLFALTLAMSVVPEEIPVAFSSFMALGAYKMSKFGVISRHPRIIENLGTATVLCLDKTGTITENRMQVHLVYDVDQDAVIENNDNVLDNNSVLLLASLASENAPFDSMEKAIVEANHIHDRQRRHSKYRMVHEYPLEGHPPMMTHVYKKDDNSIIATAKGAVERVLNVCRMGTPQYDAILKKANAFASQGYRVLGVAAASYSGSNFPPSQDDFDWKLSGLVAIYDPPKANARAALQAIRQAGVEVKLLTGDFSETALNIAGQVGIDTREGFINGEQVMAANEDTLRQLVTRVNVFSRMYPEAKLKVVNALKTDGGVVAMTGDGVNDAPALKAADIGIAMGEKGTETARRAADLVLTDDNLEKLVVAISEGRKIFANLLKGIRYIISIHIPIIITATLPALLGWKYLNIFSPVHIIFLELIMGPTCSIFFENEPAEKNLMRLPPRSRTAGLFQKNEALISIVQGLVVAGSVLFLFYSSMQAGHSIEKTRAIVFSSLIFCNVFLTFVSRSFTETIFTTIRYRNNLVIFIVVAPALFFLLLQWYTPVREFFELAVLQWNELALCLAVSFAGVMWFEVYKTGLRYFARGNSYRQQRGGQENDRVERSG